jgi:hypothetical protein
MANTYTLIASNVVGSGGVTSVTFSSIPNTYTDLIVKLSGRSSKANKQDSLSMAFNGTSTGYTNKFIEGDGAAASSFSSTDNGYNAGFVVASTMTANTFTSTDIYIPNYASSNYKSYSTDHTDEGNQSTVYSHLIACLWNNTAAITSITFSLAASNLVQYSSFYLYGIKNS